MKTICAALGMAALLTFSASADTLTLPKGHVLDFGDTVDILDGRQTYFGKQLKRSRNRRQLLSALSAVLTVRHLFT